jgi:hypothetical protein
MSTLARTGTLDLINIGLLLLSCALAFIVPFELFLFVYAFLGPLHYLTEISWLHDKNYYAKSRKDVILLVLISVALTVLFFWVRNNPEAMLEYISFEQFSLLNSNLTFIAFGSALFFAFIKKPIIKIIGVGLIILLTFLIDTPIVFFTVFLPTLVHVFVFTSLFMLYGALKSNSKVGLMSVALHLLIPFALFYLAPGFMPFEVGEYISSSYGEGFEGLNKHILQNSFDIQFAGMSPQQTFESVYNSETGIALMRFIAFAYTYHYLNWFSKTEVIRWHKVPKSRFAIVLLGWLVSIVLYAWDYALGFQWLFLLSFMHVLLEFPLNYVSFVGIFQEVRSRVAKTA